MEKMQSLLSDPESMQQLQELAQMLQADSGQESIETESAPTATDSDAALLLALKPHLREERQKKVEKAVKMLKLLSIWSMLKESGMLKDFL